MSTNGTVLTSSGLVYAGVSTPYLISQALGWLSVAYATTAFAPDIGMAIRDRKVDLPWHFTYLFVLGALLQTSGLVLTKAPPTLMVYASLYLTNLLTLFVLTLKFGIDAQSREASIEFLQKRLHLGRSFSSKFLPKASKNREEKIEARHLGPKGHFGSMEVVGEWTTPNTIAFGANATFVAVMMFLFMDRSPTSNSNHHEITQKLDAVGWTFGLIAALLFLSARMIRLLNFRKEWKVIMATYDRAIRDEKIHSPDLAKAEDELATEEEIAKKLSSDPAAPNVDPASALFIFLVLENGMGAAQFIATGFDPYLNATTRIQYIIAEIPFFIVLLVPCLIDLSTSMFALYLHKKWAQTPRGKSELGFKIKVAEQDMTRKKAVRRAHTLSEKTALMRQWELIDKIVEAAKKSKEKDIVAESVLPEIPSFAPLDNTQFFTPVDKRHSFTFNPSGRARIYPIQDRNHSFEAARKKRDKKRDGNLPLVSRPSSDSPSTSKRSLLHQNASDTSERPVSDGLHDPPSSRSASTVSSYPTEAEDDDFDNSSEYSPTSTQAHPNGFARSRQPSSISRFTTRVTSDSANEHNGYRSPQQPRVAGPKGTFPYNQAKQSERSPRPVNGHQPHPSRRAPPATASTSQSRAEEGSDNTPSDDNRADLLQVGHHA